MSSCPTLVGLGLVAARYVARLDTDQAVRAVRNVDGGGAAQDPIKDTTERKGLKETQQLGPAGDEAIRNIAIGTDGLKRQDPVNGSARLLTMEYTNTEGNETSIEDDDTSKVLFVKRFDLLIHCCSSEQTTPELPVLKPQTHIWLAESVLHMLLGRRRSLVTNALALYYPEAFADRIQQYGYSDLIVDMMNHGSTAYMRRRKCDSKLSRKSVLKVLSGSDSQVGRMAFHRVVRQELRYKKHLAYRLLPPVNFKD